MLDPPSLFLFPGMGGLDPGLAELGPACGIPTVMIHYPHWSVLSRDHGYDFATLVRQAEEQIRATVPGGAILLAGYSFGGIVAAGVAARLRDAGIDVRLLGLLDTEIRPDIDNKSGSTLRRLTRAQEFAGFLRALREGDGIGRLAYFVSRRIKDPSWKPVLDFYGATARRWLPRKFTTLLDRDLLFWHFVPLLREWDAMCGSLAPVPAPTVLFRTAQHDPAAPEHLGWEPLCPALTVVPVPGTHHDLLARSLPSTRVAFAKVVARILANSPTLHPVD